MRKAVLLAVGIWLSAVSTLSAQGVVKPESASTPAGSALPSQNEASVPSKIKLAQDIGDPGPGPGFSNLEPAPPYRVWGSAGYMMWWVKSAPVPVPLVTTGNTNDDNPGAIGQPGTQVLLGNSSVGFGACSGFRATLGAWLDPEGLIGIEGSGFHLERRSRNFFATSDDNGNPLLAFPFFNQTPTLAGEDALRISDPRPFVGQFSGSVLVVSSVQLWGAELNSAFMLYRSRGLEFTLLAGFRYADLQESLHITSNTTDLLTDPTVTVLTDNFGTRNQFYGGQLGARIRLERERFALDATGTVALGSNHEVVEIQGSTVQTGPTAVTAGTFPGGFFTEPSNLGRSVKNQFTVLPTAELKLHYRLTPGLSLFAGYEVLYWNQVVRPGNQIDRNINLNQNTPLGFGGVPGGPTAPAPLFNRTDFWAQGVTFGFEFRY